MARPLASVASIVDTRMVLRETASFSDFTREIPMVQPRSKFIPDMNKLCIVIQYPNSRVFTDAMV